MKLNKMTNLAIFNSALKQFENIVEKHMHKVMLQAIHCSIAKHNLLIIFSNYTGKLHREADAQTYRFTLFILP